MSKFWELFIVPFLTVFLSVLFFWLPKIDPLKENVKTFQRYYNATIVGIIFFLFYIHLLTIAWNVGYIFDMGKMIVFPMAILWYGIGTALPHIKQNWFMGIRTPWTMANPRVWEETHLWGGKAFRYSAVVCLIGVLLPSYLMFWFLIIPISVSGLGSVIYSYLLFKKYGNSK